MKKKIQKKNHREGMNFLCAFINSKWSPLELVKTEIVGTLDFHFGEIKLRQFWKNSFNQTIDASFFFPIDVNAAVINFACTYRGRTFTADLKTKEDASKIFEKAKAEKKFTSLVTEKSDDVFDISIGQIQANEDVTIEFDYITILKNNTFVFPFQVSERYNAALGQVDYKYSPSLKNVMLSLLLSSKNLAKYVISQTHEIKIFDKEIRLRSNQLKTNEDLVLVFKVPPKEIKNIQYNIVDQNEDFFLIFAQPDKPTSTTTTTTTTRTSTNGSSNIITEYIFIVDCSGSMDDQFKMKDVRNLMQLLLKSLPEENSFFTLVRFGSSFEFLWKGGKNYTEDNVNIASEYVQEKMNADLGGTEMLAPLKEFYRFPSSSSTVARSASQEGKELRRIVILLTDGQIFGEDIFQYVNQTSKFAKSKQQQLRLFTIGIGDQVSRATITKLARLGKGKSYFVLDTQDINAITSDLFRHMNEPVLLSVSLNNVEWEEENMGNVLIYGPNYKNQNFSNVIFSYENENGGKDQSILEFKEWEKIKINNPISLFWGKNQMFKAMYDLEMPDQEEIQRLSFKFHILSPYTAFILVDERRQEIIQSTIEAPTFEHEQQVMLASGAARPMGRGAPESKRALRSSAPMLSSKEKRKDKQLFIDIIAAQHINGSFSNTNNIIQKLEKQIPNELERVKNSTRYSEQVSPEEWATIVVLTFLYTQNIDLQAEGLTLIVDKAEKFLIQKCKSCFVTWEKEFI